jgi:hypothetical protein
VLEAQRRSGDSLLEEIRSRTFRSGAGLSGVTLINLSEKRRTGGLAPKKMFMQADKKLKTENQSTAEMYQR